MGKIFEFIKKCYSKCINLIVLKIFKIIFKVKDNYIMLESEGDYSDNILVFYNYMIKNNYNEKYKIIWIVHEPEKYKKEKNVVFISRYGYNLKIKFNYYLAVSKFFIFSHPYWLKKWKKNQVVIHTTHSIAQLKGIPSKNPNKIFDYILCCGEYGKIISKETFEKIDNEQILLIGMPRVDLMYEHKDCLKELIPNYKNEKMILVMETYKQPKNSKYIDSENLDESYAINVVRSKDELKKLDDFLQKENIKMIVKIHHLQDLSFLEMIDLNNIYYLTDDNLQEKGIQTNQLLENADILLTDYSSVFYDYLLVDRPIGFLIGDYENYKRGFVKDNIFEEMPGEKIKDLPNLFTFIKKSLNGEDDFKDERKNIRKKTFIFEDNKNCQRLYEFIENN